MATSKDPLAAAVTGVLWPYLKEHGFTRTTPRKFAREKNDVFHQLWVDANGVAGKKSTLVVLCANLPFGPVNGYMDPHGFRISNGRTWNTSTSEAADRAMHLIVETLQASELEKLNALSSVQALLDRLENFHRREWYETSSLNHQRWLAKDPEFMATVEQNRAQLKL
jgi:hypothetical protein